MFLNILKKKDNRTIQKVTKQELRENISVIKSLQDYDEGKKDIQTNKVREHLRSVRTSQ